ncbi:hypothetical protein [Jiangella sp. DSM 45060]|uniref:hypothetical protein n=1 Tax=Jiangella sp. DSM 45060 TaxID=1798224 RepID=UPI00087B3E5D|nr:hypothetical protein [Jiangella sp. DSM 45060]SDT69429.1 hypothetical protein SAMN04515669_6020 [Jiangella sp. DSM 45060]
MANGDDAAAVGYDTVAGSEDIRQAYDEINVTRDYIARHRTDGTHRADQITSGFLPVKRGGTGRGDLYGAAWAEEINRSTNAILTVSSANVLRRATGKLSPQYLGFRIHWGTWEDLNFGSSGDLALPHGAPFTPSLIMPMPRLDHDSTAILVVVRDQQPSWNSENVFIRAKVCATNAPFSGILNRLDYICLGVA